MMTKRVTNGGSVSMDLEKLTMIHKALKSKFVTHVGVLGSKTMRHGEKSSDLSNADVGLIHEKGSLSGNIPRRSFLLMPLQQKMEQVLRAKLWIWNRFLHGDQSVASLKLAYRHLGIFAENVIQHAFETGGFGKWKPSLKIAEYKGIHPGAETTPMTLIDTAQLRRSIDSRVVSK